MLCGEIISPYQHFGDLLVSSDMIISMRRNRPIRRKNGKWITREPLKGKRHFTNSRQPFCWRHPMHNSESHANEIKLSYFSVINVTVVRWRGTCRCSDAIKFGMKSLSATAQIWFKYSISQEICTRFCCALLCCGYAIVHNEFTWSIYPYSSGLLRWHWGNR